MKLVIFGLTITSSWGNGHATLWRGLCRALTRLGLSITFFERDVPYYSCTRDISVLAGVDIILYDSWEAVRARATAEVCTADAVFVTSYCPDARQATQLALAESRGVRVFYDLDTPVTLAALAKGLSPSYVDVDGLGGFDLVLSYTGGTALDGLRTQLGAQNVIPLYGHVDPALHHAAKPVDDLRCDLSYLGTYSADRQDTLQELFLTPAARLPNRRFMLAGAQYPRDFPWRDNIWYRPHVTPPEHPAFYSSSRLTLNVTRRVMADMGYCPSGRLFEAAACGVPIVSDAWNGLDFFFEPGREITVCKTADEVVDAMQASDADLRRQARAAYARVMEEHTAAHRASELLAALEKTRRGGAHVGDHSRGRQGQSDSAAGVLEGAPSRR